MQCPRTLHWNVSCIGDRQMLPTSHLAPRNVPEPRALFAGPVPAEASMLADAFSEFIAAAARLEASYSELQEQVAQLGVELAERNTALNASLAENQRMRLALQGIVDSMPCGVLVLERDGALSMINPEGMRLLELEPAYAHAASLGAISARIGIDLGSLVCDDRVQEGEQEFSLPGTAGKRWIEVRNRRLYARAGAEAGCTNGRGNGAREHGRRGRWSQTILILRDVTAHKQAEQERERGRRATALAEVAAMLAHEIRNPLASLELFAGLLAGSSCLAQGAGAEQQWIAHMRAGIRSLSGTVNNVLSFHGAGFPSLAPLALNEAIASSVEFVRPITEQAGIELALALEPALEPTLNTSASASPRLVLGNASALQQLVLNLVSNAVRHTPQRGRIQVTVRSLTGAPRAEVSVTDTGCGIAPEHLSEIFRAGFSGGGDSSGLGLAVCSQIVRQHEGTLRVVSEPGRGATFLVELPTL